MLMAKRVSFEGKVCLGSDKRGGQREKRAGLQEDNVIIDHIESFNPNGFACAHRNLQLHISSHTLQTAVKYNARDYWLTSQNSRPASPS